MQRRVRLLSALVSLPALATAGCTPERVHATARNGVTAALSPAEYQLLRDGDKVRYKDVVLRIPASWGGVALPADAGPYPSPLDKSIHGGDLGTLMGLYNQSLFEFQHPRVRVEYIQFDMWSQNFRSALAVALSAKRAPAYYIARDLPQTIEQGMYADLTPLMKQWDQFGNQPESSIREGTVDGHIYTMAANELGASVIRYRKDWFREAGIFNEHGEPGPRSDWTWDDFRRIAKKLTDPRRGRFGYCGEMGDFLRHQAYVIDLFIPDPTGKRTWVFNDKDPELLRSLQAAREMVNKDQSVSTSVSTGWFEWHKEFDASHAAMIVSFSPHIASEYLTTPEKFGKDKPYGDTVGMAAPPGGSAGYSPLRPVTNPIGFDPTLTPEQLSAAFDWCKSYFYGDLFTNRMRAAVQDAKIKGTKSSLYAELLVLPYKPQENLLDRPLSEVFPPDYLRLYDRIRAGHAPPLPREFGLREPANAELNQAIRAMYSEAITSNVDLKALIAKTANLVNTNLLNYHLPGDGARLRRYVDARTAFYQRYFPEFYRTVWQQRLQTLYRLPEGVD
jgi:hypothetical protein